MGVLVFVRLLHHRVFEIVAFAQGAVAMVVVVHPLIDGRGLLADRLQRRVRMQKGKRGCQAIVRNTVHPDFAVVVGNILQQPFDRVVGVGSLVGGFRIVEIDPGGQIELAFGFEASPQVLDDEDVAILRKFFERGGHLLQRFLRNPVRRAAEENGQRTLLVHGSENCRLQADAIAHRNHNFLQLERRLSGTLGGCLWGGCDDKQKKRKNQQVRRTHDIVLPGLR